MYICEICKKEFKNLNSLAKHIKVHNISNKEYYDKYLKQENEGICKQCGKEHDKYVNFSEGYRKYCGDPCPTNDFLYNQLKESMKNKYGVENCSSLESVKEKRKNTTSKNHGVDNPAKKDEFKKDKKYWEKNKKLAEKAREKTKQTFERKYDGHPSKHPEIKEKTKQTNLNNHLEKLREKLKKDNLELLDEYIPGKNVNLKFKCLKCNNVFLTTWQNLYQRFDKCPFCSIKKHGYSNQEDEIVDFIKSINKDLNIIRNSKQIIPPKELDIYIQDKNIAIEFNGLYWHSEVFNSDPNFHLNKTIECENKGIQLIHIFEDEWLYQQNIVKARLKQILGINNNAIKINARECKIQEITSKTKNTFLDEYHLQGKDASNIKIGAFYNGKLISVMTFSHGNIAKGSRNKKDDVWELNRFCSDYNYHIPGIASKLLKYFQRNYNWQRIFSYADRRWSIGNLYYKLGFKFEYCTKPNYWYSLGYKRIHRFTLRKRPDEPKDVSEQILRDAEGYIRIWDCGHHKFSIEKEQN